MSNAETQTVVRSPENGQETSTVDLTNVFGKGYGNLPTAQKKYIEAAMASPNSDPTLYKMLQEGSVKNIGKVAGDVPANFEQSSADDFVMKLRHKAVAKLGVPAAFLGRAWGRMTKNDVLIAKSQKKRNPGESDAEYYARMKSHAKTTAAMGALAILGAASGGAAALGASTATVFGLKGAALTGSIANGVWQARRKDGLANPLAGVAGGVTALGAGAASHTDVFPGSNHAASQEYTLLNDDESAEGTVPVSEPNRARGAEEYPSLSAQEDEPTYRYNSQEDNTPFDANKDDAPAASPEVAAEVSRAQELTFLEENGRHNNDFNSITPEELNDPANEGRFPGYTALFEQYNESPQELAAQLYQIYEIESANGHTFDALPPELRELAGGNGEAFIEALAQAMHADPELHDTLTAATLDYIQEHGSPLSDLTGNYEANYIVIEDGKPVVKFDPNVTSAVDNDTVIMLSETKGIRFPCGQPIEILPQPEYVTPVYSAPPVSYETPTYTPPVETTPPTTVPPVGEPPVTEPPVINPPNPEPPVVIPEPKDERQNFDHAVPDFFKAGEIVGSGAPQTREEVVTPSETFNPGTTTPSNGNEQAPGASATPSGSAGSESAQAGSSSEGGNSGNVDGNS